MPLPMTIPPLEATLPAVLELLPVVDARGRVTDFVCVASTPSMAPVLAAPSGEVVGLRLRRLLARHPDRGTLLPACLGAFTSGQPCTCRTPNPCGDEPGVLVHEISRTSRGGVTVRIRSGSV